MLLLATSGKVLSRTSVQRVTYLELQVEENKRKCAEHPTLIAERIDDPDHIARDENGDLIIPGDRDIPKFNEQIHD